MKVNLFSFRQEDLEDTIDAVKTATIHGLVNEGLISKEAGEKWCEEHTLIIRKKNIFKTLSDKFFNAEEAKDGFYIICVKKVT